MKKFNLSKKVVYTKNGAEATYWANVGTMTEFDNGNRIIEIPAIGLTASVFPQDDRKPLEKPEFIKAQEAEKTVDVSDEQIDEDTIPF